MAATTLFDTVDALVATITALPVCAASNGVFVSDGFPAELSANTVVAIGGTTNPTVALTSATVTMGEQSVRETYEVEGTISCMSGGTDQSVPRNTAKTVYEAIQAAIRSSMLAGGNRLGVANLMFAEMFAVDLKQSDENDHDTGRQATLTFKVRCEAWI